MVITTKKLSAKKTLYLEKYNNFSDFINTVERRNTDAPRSTHNDMRNLISDPSWVGVKSWDEVKSLILNGYDAPVKKLNAAFIKEVNNLNERQAKVMVNDVAGYVVNVPAYLKGLPQHMINIKKTTKKYKILNILIEGGVSCDVSASKLTDQFAKILAKIALLEKSGYRCRIELLNTFAAGEGSWQFKGQKIAPAFKVLLKSESQPFDIKRIAFPIVHPAMLRACGFAWENSIPEIDYNSYHVSGLGKPLTRNNFPELYDKFIAASVENNSKNICVNYYNTKELDDLIKEGR